MQLPEKYKENFDISRAKTPTNASCNCISVQHALIPTTHVRSVRPCIVIKF